MTLETWVKNAWLEKRGSDRDEIRRLLALADGRLEDYQRAVAGKLSADVIARIEIDHVTLWSRSSLMVSVESVPPRRYLRWARKPCVNLGLAKNGLAGSGDADTILATRRPRSVTYTSPARARRTHRPVAW
jgi:hypothetical protein